MPINLPDLRYIRRSLGEITVLRQLVSFQRCKVINPSEFWLALMTRMSESSVRRALVKLKKSGLISYTKRKQDFRGPNRPTNTYTLHAERIQALIDAGRKVVDKALGEYYEKAGTPRHGRKRPVRLTGQSQEQPVKLTGYTTGQNDPQDVSLSIENLLVSKVGDYKPPYSEEYMESSDELSWEDLRDREDLYYEGVGRNNNLCQGSTSKELEQSRLNTKLTIPTPSPNSAAPPSPPLPPAPAKPGEEEFFYGRQGLSIFKVYPESGRCVPYHLDPS
jgi:DNA-binding transcriptional ArsR family regulator